MVKNESKTKSEPAADEKSENGKLPWTTQMLIEKAEEEAMYAKRGETSLKNYYRNMEDASQIAAEKYSMHFDDCLSLARRQQALEDMRLAKKLEVNRTKWKQLKLKQQIDKEVAKADKAVEKEQENKHFENELRKRDRQIEQLQSKLRRKSPQQKAFERRIHRKQTKTQNLSHVQSWFKFPLIRKVAGKLYKVDKAVSDFLLDIGNAEFVITKENVISTFARRLMNVRAVDEPEFYFDEKGDLVSRWSYLAYNRNGNTADLKKAKKSLLDLVKNS